MLHCNKAIAFEFGEPQQENQLLQRSVIRPQYF